MTGVEQKARETLVELFSRIEALVEVASPDPGRKSYPIFQFQLVDYFIDSLRNPQLREDVARRWPVILKEAFEEVRASKSMLVQLR